MPGQDVSQSRYGTLPAKPSSPDENAAGSSPALVWVREDTRDEWLGCIPLRYCAGFHALKTIVLSVLALSVFVSEDAREIVGGFTLGSDIAVKVLGVAGFFISVPAFIGVLDRKSTWVWLLSGYLLVRVLMRAVILIIDIQVLLHCDDLSPNGTTITSLTGRFNRALATPALAGTCHRTLIVYAVASAVDVVMSFVGARATFCWCRNTERPVYGISFDDSHVLAYLLRQRAKEEEQEAMRV
mmetsp:Transcript_44982/g.106842  ORF Transcript_44982/g.106842 Transcript_44982/m.106842 type:complete len:241 (-) Transcript_44982:84-806(-)|eukprot:CAMPEP_0178411366 /NCGR_PEP_ID=MMETSP0689_2-20121128/21458_1 /TAXON_ID=160604 /ORGANISM="Amphidinium massartii, Strain CS-259" /LENGTH=240 /DNA_ID=CAMNT_0020032571 /DNA_START=65 /DNA_END=787 /DNA_ORIENTATION=+